MHAFGWDSDMARYGPHAQLTANTENWGVYYVSELKKVFDGTWTGNRRVQWGLKENAVVLTPLDAAVLAEVARLFRPGKRPSSRAAWCCSPVRSRTTPAPCAFPPPAPCSDDLRKHHLVRRGRGRKIPQ